MKTVLLQICNEQMSDYLVLDYILKIVAYGLLVIAFSGIGKMIFEIIILMVKPILQRIDNNK